MDPGTALAVIGMATSIIGTCVRIVEDIKEAPSDIQLIRSEVSSLKTIVQEFQTPQLASIPGLIDHLPACHDRLTRLRGLLPSQTTTRPKWERLNWSRKSSQARKLLLELSQQKTTMLLSLANHSAQELTTILATVQRLKDKQTDTERQKIFNWLEKTNPSAKHNQSFELHEKHTSEWILRLPKWEDWLDQTASTRFLWLSGIPGSGKAVLTSFLIEEVKSFCKTSAQGWAYYYCLFSNNQNETIPFLCWIVCQLGWRARFVPHNIVSLYVESIAPKVPDLEDALEEILATQLDVAFVLIDGVDESEEREDLVAIIRSLAQDVRFEKLRLLASSRMLPDIQQGFGASCVAISMSNPEVDKDIRTYIKLALAPSERLNKWYKNNLVDVEDALVAGAKGM
ncbi:vegetative incompatibility protein het-e-1 [Grosmannia clavigera kw1407]|uniref:Vegetative incompatibility protein het-e-1 n=1 Tax=Grosmannia clavigera (strain kw1407 / UAMH 11150) TaxID=655863 RepID=F0XFS1_GROCL|nr:vegetative incompatibility protein het-e-1 [Grosmannia clavigera kw1407]EFX04154.1 vegetative incompatibility protein het-e-1 [Grosmannia clavigera kw1407]